MNKKTIALLIVLLMLDFLHHSMFIGMGTVSFAIGIYMVINGYGLMSSSGWILCAGCAFVVYRLHLRLVAAEDEIDGMRKRAVTD